MPKQKKFNKKIEISKPKIIAPKTIEKISDKKPASKKEIILIRRNHPLDEKEAEDFEGVEEDSSDNFSRIRAPAPFLQARRIINLEQDLENVPTTRTDDAPTSVNYATAAKPNYATTAAPSYTGAAGNAPVYSDQESQINRQNFQAQKLFLIHIQ